MTIDGQGLGHKFVFLCPSNVAYYLLYLLSPISALHCGIALGIYVATDGNLVVVMLLTYEKMSEYQICEEIQPRT